MKIINDKQPKRLYRSRNRKIAGVCQGIADYLNVDVVAVRIVFLATLLLGSLGFWIYLICWLLMPLESN